jgi:hypothetical protein
MSWAENGRAFIVIKTVQPFIQRKIDLQKWDVWIKPNP